MKTKEEILTGIKVKYYGHNTRTTLTDEMVLEALEEYAKEKGELKYENGKTAGQIAKEYGIATGEIGCPNCGIVRHGAQFSNICECCDKPLFKDSLESMLSELPVGEYTVKTPHKLIFEGSTLTEAVTKYYEFLKKK